MGRSRKETPRKDDVSFIVREFEIDKVPRKDIIARLLNWFESVPTIGVSRRPFRNDSSASG